MRGVAYSPTPIGSSPPTGDLHADFFGPGDAHIYGRDLPLLSALGANTIRLFKLDPSKDHTDFFDRCVQQNLTVLAGFELTAGRYQLNTLQGQRLASADLERALELIAHEAITTWLIGDQLNAPWSDF
eukprot:3188630-Prymnesium_polylepis.1